MKDIQQNIKRSAIPRKTSKAPSWFSAVLEVFIKLIIAPMRFIGPTLALGLGIMKIVLIVVGFVTTGLLVALTIIFQTIWNTDGNPFAHAFATVENETALVVNVDAQLTDKTQLSLGGYLKNTPRGLYPTLETIRKAQEDKRISGIVLKISDHNLGTSDIQELRMALQDFRKAKKWVVAYACDFHETVNNATASYYLASAADEIWVHPLAQLDIIGVSSEQMFVRGFLDKIKVAPHFIKRGRYKLAPERFTEKAPSELNKEVTKELVLGLADQIVQGVAEGRELKVDQVHEIIDNAPWTDRQALKQGLVDNLVYSDELRKKVKEHFAGAKNFIALDKYAQAALTPTDSKTLKKKAKEVFAKEFRVAVLEFEGAISFSSSPTPSSNSESIDAIKFKERLKEAVKKKPDALLLVINSPGGTSMASEMAARAILKARKKIPVVVLMGDVCASGGYWIASAADRIVAKPATITGSIGVFMGRINTSGFWSDWGVMWHQQHSHKNGPLFSSQTELTEEDKVKLEDMVSATYDDFIDLVMNRRKLPRKHVEDIAEGRVWLGQQALANKLIDRLGGYSQALEECILLKHKTSKDVVLKVDFHQQPFSLRHIMRQAIWGEMRIFFAQMVSYLKAKLTQAELSIH